MTRCSLGCVRHGCVSGSVQMNFSSACAARLKVRVLGHHIPVCRRSKSCRTSTVQGVQMPVYQA